MSIRCGDEALKQFSRKETGTAIVEEWGADVGSFDELAKCLDVAADDVIRYLVRRAEELGEAHLAVRFTVSFVGRDGNRKTGFVISAQVVPRAFALLQRRGAGGIDVRFEAVLDWFVDDVREEVCSSLSFARSDVPGASTSIVVGEGNHETSVEVRFLFPCGDAPRPRIPGAHSNNAVVADVPVPVNLGDYRVAVDVLRRFLLPLARSRNRLFWAMVRPLPKIHARIRESLKPRGNEYVAVLLQTNTVVHGADPDQLIDVVTGVAEVSDKLGNIYGLWTVLATRSRPLLDAVKVVAMDNYVGRAFMFMVNARVAPSPHGSGFEISDNAVAAVRVADFVRVLGDVHLVASIDYEVELFTDKYARIGFTLSMARETEMFAVPYSPNLPPSQALLIQPTPRTGDTSTSYISTTVYSLDVVKQELRNWPDLGAGALRAAHELADDAYTYVGSVFGNLLILATAGALKGLINIYRIAAKHDPRTYLDIAGRLDREGLATMLMPSLESILGLSRTDTEYVVEWVREFVERLSHVFTVQRATGSNYIVVS